MKQQTAQLLLAHVQRIMKLHAKQIKPTYGRDLVDFPPDELILETLTLKYGENELELGTTTEAARPAFEWLAEITMREVDAYAHFLLRPDGDIIEAYGRKTNPATPEAIVDLLAYLASIR